MLYAASAHDLYQHISKAFLPSIRHVLVQYASSFSEAELIEKAKQAGVKVYPTALYFSKAPPSVPYIQLGFSGLSPEQIRLGVQLLKEAWT